MLCRRKSTTGAERPLGCTGVVECPVSALYPHLHSPHLRMIAEFGCRTTLRCQRPREPILRDGGLSLLLANTTAGNLRLSITFLFSTSSALCPRTSRTTQTRCKHATAGSHYRKHATAYRVHAAIARALPCLYAALMASEITTRREPAEESNSMHEAPKLASIICR